MIKLTENKGTVMTCFCEILVGILLFINLVGFTSGIKPFVGSNYIAQSVWFHHCSLDIYCSNPNFRGSS